MVIRDIDWGVCGAERLHNLNMALSIAVENSKILFLRFGNMGLYYDSFFLTTVKEISGKDC